MHILELKVMRGPNYWSNYRKQLIVMKLDIGSLEELPTNKIDGFAERLEKTIPSLHEHRCSEEHPGGFLNRVRAGTWMGHVVEHIALEIQTLAGMDCGFGRTRSTSKKGVYLVCFDYVFEEAGKLAAKFSVDIAEQIIKNENVDLQNIIDELKRIYRRRKFGPSTESLIEEAKRRNIPWRRLDDESLILFGYGKYQKKIRATIAQNTGSIGVETACNKEATKKILKAACIPVPTGSIIFDQSDLETALESCGLPAVIKPLNGNHGRGVTTQIYSAEAAIDAFNIAKQISDAVIVEKFIEGSDFRLLVINYKLVAAAKRIPPFIKGDGVKTVKELIDELNTDPRRGTGHENLLTKIIIDTATEAILAQYGLNLNSVVEENEIIYLKNTANISTGGTATDVTDLVHPSIAYLAERTARNIGLDICGIDIIAKNINQPLTNDNGAIIEVNAAPGFRMHLSPSHGLPRNVAAPVMDMLFPENAKSRIPIIAVTGTNGKTTTTRLCAHMAMSVGNSVGFTTTDGIYLRNELVVKGDCTGPASASVVLTDPTVDFAVLECARGGILRAGLGFDECDISIITNVTEDHLGLSDIDSIGQMAKVKAVVARSTKKDGFAILNSDDDLVYGMRREVDSNIALFGMSENERIIRHCNNGGLAAYLSDDIIIVQHGKWINRIDRVNNIPLTFEGRAECMIKNILPAILAAVISNFSVESIRNSLRTFYPSAEQTPGRFNLFNFGSVNVMVDYAHNKDGFTELKKFLDKTPASFKIGIVSATGDRKEEDIRNVGRFAAMMFNEIIIRHDKDLRGCPKEKSNALIMEGIYSVDKSTEVSIISDELEALTVAIRRAQPDSLIVLCADDVSGVINFLTAQEEALRSEADYQILIAS